MKKNYIPPPERRVCVFVVVLILISDYFTGQLQTLVIVMGVLRDGKDFFYIKLNPF